MLEEERRSAYEQSLAALSASKEPVGTSDFRKEALFHRVAFEMMQRAFSSQQPAQALNDLIKQNADFMGKANVGTIFKKIVHDFSAQTQSEFRMILPAIYPVVQRLIDKNQIESGDLCTTLYALAKIYSEELKQRPASAIEALKPWLALLLPAIQAALPFFRAIDINIFCMAFNELNLDRSYWTTELHDALLLSIEKNAYQVYLSTLFNYLSLLYKLKINRGGLTDKMARLLIESFVNLYRKLRYIQPSEINEAIILLPMLLKMGFDRDLLLPDFCHAYIKKLIACDKRIFNPRLLLECIMAMAHLQLTSEPALVLIKEFYAAINEKAQSIAFWQSLSPAICQIYYLALQYYELSIPDHLAVFIQSLPKIMPQNCDFHRPLAEFICLAYPGAVCSYLTEIKAYDAMLPQHKVLISIIPNKSVKFNPLGAEAAEERNLAVQGWKVIKLSYLDIYHDLAPLGLEQHAARIKQFIDPHLPAPIAPNAQVYSEQYSSSAGQSLDPKLAWLGQPAASASSTVSQTSAESTAQLPVASFLMREANSLIQASIDTAPGQ
jgi:hypothetical protein